MKSKALLSIPLLLIFSLFVACEDDRSISFDDSEIEYDRSVTRMEANRLGRYLTQSGFFEKGDRQEISISKDDYEYELSWEVPSDFVPSPAGLAYFYKLVDSVEKHVFDQSEVSVSMRLYSERNRYEWWNLDDEMPAYHQSQKHTIYYERPVTEEMAVKFGEILDDQDFFNPEGEVFLIEQERDRVILGLATRNRKSNEFKSRFAELRVNSVSELTDDSKGLVFEIRGQLLDGIEESISGPFFPNSTSANGIKIRYDDSITNEDISLLREYIKQNNLRWPDWLAFVRTEDKGTGRYQLTIPTRDINDMGDTQRAKNFALAMSMKLLGSYVDVVLLDENAGTEKLIKAESMR
jgi:hypothetical protein